MVNPQNRTLVRLSDLLLERVSICIVISFASIMSLYNIDVARAGNYVTGTNQGGTLILNEVDGKIVFCGTQLVIKQFSGTCGQIGTMPTASLAGNAQITVTSPGYSVVVTGTANYEVGSYIIIVNTATGIVVECPAFSYLGAPVGQCGNPQQAP